MHPVPHTTFKVVDRKLVDSSSWYGNFIGRTKQAPGHAFHTHIYTQNLENYSWSIDILFLGFENFSSNI